MNAEESVVEPDSGSGSGYAESLWYAIMIFIFASLLVGFQINSLLLKVLSDAAGSEVAYKCVLLCLFGLALGLSIKRVSALLKTIGKSRDGNASVSQ